MHDFWDNPELERLIELHAVRGDKWFTWEGQRVSTYGLSHGLKQHRTHALGGEFTRETVDRAEWDAMSQAEREMVGMVLYL